MKVLLTGSSGFLGRYVLNALQQQQAEVVAIGRCHPGVLVDFFQVDLLSVADFVPLLEQIKPTHLLHLAWYAEHGKFWVSPLNLRWMEATVRLIEGFCAIGGRRVVVAGTCAEYDWTYGYCREDYTPLNPATVYGAAKDAVRRLGKAICEQHHVSYAWGRVFFPFGTGEASVRLIPSLINVFRDQQAAFGVNANIYRDFLHASDVAEGFITLLRNNTDGVFNISSGQPVQLALLVQEIARIMDVDPLPVLELTKTHSDELPFLVGENIKLRALGWQPRLSLAQGLERSINEVKNDGAKMPGM